MVINPEVREALRVGKAVVALESSMIFTNRADPNHLGNVKSILSIVKDEGAIPAAIAVLKGEPIIGLDIDQVQNIPPSTHVRHSGRKDLPIVVGLKLDSATNISASIFLAQRVGIRVLLTGAIGGVHRNRPFDISSDLDELSRNPMVIVCSGAKALLDIEATRERLETLGVTILGFGVDEFPAFYSHESGFLVDFRVSNAEEIVTIAHARNSLGIRASILVGVPVPEDSALPLPTIEDAVQKANQMAYDEGVHGSALTPFLMSRINDLTNGLAHQAVTSLLENNARVAAQIARAFADSDLSATVAKPS